MASGSGEVVVVGGGGESREVQTEELQVLQSIYGDDCEVDLEAFSCKLGVADTGLVLSAHLPVDYPAIEPPVFLLEGAADDAKREWACSQLEQLYWQTPGEVVLFKWVEWLKSEQESIARPAQSASASIATSVAAPLQQHADDFHKVVQTEETALKLQHEAQRASKTLSSSISVFHGEPFTERRSTFQAHVAVVKSVDDVQLVMNELMQNKKVAAATHNIMAYRIKLEGRNTFAQDSDDDGETAAGSRLLHLLQITDACNVCVVVSRWYGGILLGPDRFKYITNAARDILQQFGMLEGAGEKDKSRGMQTEVVALRSNTGKRCRIALRVHKAAPCPSIVKLATFWVGQGSVGKR
eukprot:jgi/Chlat1/838/Chrsp104S01177